MPISKEEEDSLLTDLCTICHIQPPKYRCPRCATRTCSLPCTRRHKLWSQCSGIRDPAAYLRRNELATEAAFDRDFNFITGIERSIERAGRDAENRGIRVDGASAGFVRDLAVVGLEDSPVGSEREGGAEGPNLGKRKRGGQHRNGPLRGESGFLREVEKAGVKLIRAPRGMSRNKENGSKWFARQQCLVWTVEWIESNGDKRVRKCRDSVSIANFYDRSFPPNRAEREKEEGKEQIQDPEQEDQAQPQPDSSLTTDAQQSQDTAAVTTNADPTTISEPTATATTETQPDITPTATPSETETHTIVPHRDVYFYLHRPRTATKQPVLIPLAPGMTLTAALRGHTVLEFPTIYVLPDSPDMLRAQGPDAGYLLEEEYTRTHAPAEEDSASPGDSEVDQPPSTGIDLGGVDEKKVLEVLKKDLFEPSTLA
ncbi:zinc finger HIT domain-containing protein [Aspergillus homomorphus CBS 101889]|uniref:Box C/D snoRNA protein 1 n=1 Tax=Aspergillus homomorphus (strain CBS 101889) TaxID=1450537 RepID=A0A395I8Q8_ASPHC|nr:hypothetical protein BO97DRAFT_386244 [Aspergillus homomorphus CBS 101889]RAL14524.1 hypothetical protein BO97DRAFT_386244 [Aspergillus homomorphus CBS 101889]